jgi:hypothetical protein
MLAPFVINLLISSLSLLLLGWAVDVISGWVDSRKSWVERCQRHETAGAMGLLIHRAVSDSRRFTPVPAGMTPTRARAMTRS